MGKLNLRLKLNERMFSDEVEKFSIRNGYGKGLLEAGKDNENVVALSADLTESTRTLAFAEAFPERFIQVGVAEQNLATVAAGLGVSGKIPFISSFAVFSPGRNWEQIRTTIAYNDSNVKIAGHHAGIATGSDGATHQATEDIATMRTIANMKVFVPCDTEEARKATLYAAKIWGPAYIRLSRAEVPAITTNDTRFTPGKADKFWDSRSPEAVIIACGTMVYESLVAAKNLEEEGISVVVLNNHTIKPLDEETIVDLAGKAGAVVTAEDHSIFGGLGGAVAELLAREKPVPMEFVGVKDSFGESGSFEELKEKYNLTSGDIIKAVKCVLRRKT